jgi:hypothetical protein
VEVDVGVVEHRGHRRQPSRVVVVAGDHHHRPAAAAEVEQGAVDDAFGLG